MSHLFETIKAGVVQDIVAGRYDVGTVLPPADELASRHQCSTATVRRALTELAGEGVVRRVRAKGTVVRRRPGLGTAWVVLPTDDHLRLILQDPVYHALIDAGFEVTLLPGSIEPQRLAAQVQRQRGLSSERQLLVWLGSEQPTNLESVLPVVDALVAYSLGQVPLPAGAGLVMPDHQRSARLVVEHLLGLGHRRIAVAGGFTEGEATWAGRSAAYARDLVEIAGGQCTEITLGALGEARLMELVTRQGYTAFWALNDHEALTGEMRALRRGLAVPGTLSLVGRWDTPWSQRAPTPLTSLSLDPHATAAALARWLTTAVQHEDPPALVRVEPRLVIRQSTAPPKA